MASLPVLAMVTVLHAMLASAQPSNVPLLQWVTQVDQSGVWAYNMVVSVGSRCSKDAAVWDTGLVWQENEPFNGTCHYTGPALQKSTLYSWCCWETQLRSASGALVNKTWFAGNGTFTTSAFLPSVVDEARSAVNATNVTSIYRGTMQSIIGRIAPSGWMPTSVASTTYTGMFLRDSCSGVFALLELEEYSLARSVLEFMLSHMKAADLPYAPHVLYGNPNNVTGWDMVDQPDGAFHLVIAWARYILLTGDTAMETNYYPLMARFLDYYCAPGAKYNGTVFYFNTTLQLLWNPNLEHSRVGHYWSCFDVLTNFFAVEALRHMSNIAQERGDQSTSTRWAQLRSRLLTGLSSSLKYGPAPETANQPIYAELLGHWHEWGGAMVEEPAPLLWGMSWVNLGGIPAVGPAIMGASDPVSLQTVGLDGAVMDATLDTYERLGYFFWEADAFSTQVPQTHINASTLTDPARVVIGKGWAWLTAWLVYRLDYTSLIAQHRWLAAAAVNNTLYGESYVYDCIRLHETGCWGDIGNAEQSSWFVWAQAVIRKRLDLPWRYNGA